MTWFRPIAPSPPLRDLLDCRYVAVSAGHHDLLPDGCMDLVWAADLGVVLCGPDTTGWSFDMPPGREVAGLRFRPGAASGVFGIAASELVDRRVPLADLLGERPARLLAARLAEAADGTARMVAIEELVLSRRAAADPTIEMATFVATDPSTPVDVLADRAGVSACQLRRRFDRTVGYGPAFLARVARLQRFAKSAVRSPALGIAELAAAAGYVDQSHLAKDVRAIVGRTPRQLLDLLAGSSLTVDLGAGDRSVQDAIGGARARWAA